MVICKNCAASFKGKFCNVCGEKVVESSDFTIRSIISRGFGAITNFDSKFYKTVFYLFFKPGALTKRFVEGVRVPFMKPFQIFVIANIIFFFFLSELDIFRTPAKWYFYEENTAIMARAQEIMQSKEWTLDQVKVEYDKLSSTLAKGLIILFIPFIAFFGYIFHYKSKMEFGKHLIFAIHYFSFFLLICVLWTELMESIANQYSKYFFIIPINAIFLFHYILGLKNFYDNSWIKAIVKGVISYLLIGSLIMMYRVLMNNLTLNFLG